MQLEFFFQPCRYDGTKAEGRNPFTGENCLVPKNEPLTDSELSAVRAELERVSAQGPDEFGRYVIAFDDGSEVGVYANDLETGCLVSFRCLPTSLFMFALDLLKAGNWVLLPAVESTVVAATSMESVKGVPAGFPPIVICNSPEELKVLITAGLDAWNQLRDQVGKPKCEEYRS